MSWSLVFCFLIPLVIWTGMFLILPVVQALLGVAAGGSAALVGVPAEVALIRYSISTAHVDAHANAHLYANLLG